MHPKEQCRMLLNELLRLAEETIAAAKAIDAEKINKLVRQRRDCWLLLSDLTNGKQFESWRLVQLVKTLKVKEALAKSAIQDARDRAGAGMRAR